MWDLAFVISRNLDQFQSRPSYLSTTRRTADQILHFVLYHPFYCTIFIFFLSRSLASLPFSAANDCKSDFRPLAICLMTSWRSLANHIRLDRSPTTIDQRNRAPSPCEMWMGQRHQPIKWPYLTTVHAICGHFQMSIKRKVNYRTKAFVSDSDWFGGRFGFSAGRKWPPCHWPARKRIFIEPRVFCSPSPVMVFCIANIATAVTAVGQRAMDNINEK